MQRVAVVGAGGMGGVHAGAYARMPGADLVAVCDIVMEKAEAMAERLSTRAFGSFEEMMKEVEVDVIDVCTPTPVHLEIIKKAAAAGKNVCTEKPLARTTGQAMEAVRLCKDAGVTMFVAHVVRWFPEFRKINEMVKAGAVGDPAMVRTSRCGGPPGKWFGDFKQSGGVVLDLIIHDFDWIRWTFGPVKKVYAKGLYSAGLPNGGDYALVTLRLANGTIAHVEGSWARIGGFETSVEVAGSTGLLSYNSGESVPLTVQLRGKDGMQTGQVIPESPVSVDPYYQELEHFLKCLDEGLTPDVTPDDGLEAVRIAEAALRSMSTGQPVMLA